ncbi:MAG: 2-amino-4-hydroxy-6-hydroxymethyldihydropteridine diphosphokinase [Sulfuriflexus sp.]|nr:2-amino-4-hydroxy-6-hydroxymethyldihydropteridine diphosphokinase [Sulfuriflexus sp.]
MADVISYIGLGSNLEGPVQQLSNALEALRQLPQTTFVSCSSFYSSKALTLNDDSVAPDYLNAVAVIETGLDAVTLLDELQAIEFSQGRRRDGERWASRPLDLDILLYGNESIATERLTVPHPEICQRDFVLQPLAEVAPELVITGQGSISSCLDACPKMILEKSPCPKR